jgi:hypothetical protein
MLRVDGVVVVSTVDMMIKRKGGDECTVDMIMTMIKCNGGSNAARCCC